MKPSREIRNAVLGLFHDMWTGLVDHVLADSEDVVVFGTGPDEFARGADVVRAGFQAQAEIIGKIKLVPETLYAYEEGTVGWAVGEVRIERSNGRSKLVRISVVLHKEGTDWKVVHLHASEGVADAEFWGVENIPIERIARDVEEERPDLTPVASPEGTLTIIFADMEGSTALNEELGDDRFVPLLIKQRDIVHERSKSFGGSIVKSEGDGFMLAFPSARKGVECAVAVQREITQLSERLKVRMGIHTGEPTRHADDFYGRDVAYAARLGTAAAGGEILVSSLVKSLVEPSGSVKFQGPRELDLKGFDGPQPVFAVVWQ